MTEITSWLQSLELQEYNELFTEQRVDLEVMSELQESDLEKLAIPLGHRKKLLKAISELRTAALPELTMPQRFPEPERRQLTIMFCDLVDFTSLSSRIDPEELSDIIRGYQDTCHGILQKFTGYLARYLGDGVLAYFGFPQAHENDAELAVWAALEIIRSVSTIETELHAPLQVRIGIATGLVVAGNTQMGISSEKQIAIGETPNLAARLQTLAAPNTIYISDQTRKLAGGIFEYSDAGVFEIKGFSAPIQVWQVERANKVENRFNAMHTADLSPMVGRDQDLELLMERWTWSKAGDGQVILLRGAPGIGKSRITRELQDRIRGEAKTVFHFQCSAHHENSALHPFMEQIKQVANLDLDQSVEQITAQLTELAQSAGVSPEMLIPDLSLLLSIPILDQQPPLEVGDRNRKDVFFTFIVGLLERWIDNQPALLIVEDIQWIDPTSEELLGIIAERAQMSRLLIVMTSRDGDVQKWDAYPHVTSLTINRLTPAHQSVLVETLCEGRELSAVALNQIVSKADGIPMFVEELTKVLLESGVLRRNQSKLAYEPLLPLVIPPTLQDLLTERLDNLGPAKRIAQIAACIGKEFSVNLLAAAADSTPTDLELGIRMLLGANLIVQKGMQPESIYSFRHALVQDAAYESLLRTRRRGIHARIAQHLLHEQRTGSDHADTIARHLREAGNFIEAMNYFMLAAHQATEFSANKEALRHTDEAAQLLQKVSVDDLRLMYELRILLTRGKALRAQRGSFSSETRAAYGRAWDICEQLEPQLLDDNNYADYLHALYGRSASAFDQANLTVAREAAEKLIVIGPRHGDLTAHVAGYQAIGMCEYAAGNFEIARQHLEEAWSQGDSAALMLEIRDAQFPSLTLTYLSWTMFVLGHTNQARSHSLKAIDSASERSVLYRAITLCNVCYTFQFFKDHKTVSMHAERLTELAARYDMTTWFDMGRFFEGWSQVTTGDVHAGLEKMSEVVNRWQAVSLSNGGSEGGIEMPYLIALWAECLAIDGQFKLALQQLEYAAQLAERTGERWYDAEIERLRGELLLRRGNQTDRIRAQDCFERALSTARRMHAKTWELRAALSLASYKNDPVSTRMLLQSLYQWFEGEMLPELQQAERLLQDL